MAGHIQLTRNACPTCEFNATVRPQNDRSYGIPEPVHVKHEFAGSCRTQSLARRSR